MSDFAKHNRQHSVTWADPAVLQGIEKTRPWIDILRGMVAGALPLPPSFELQGFKPISVEPGMAPGIRFLTSRRAIEALPSGKWKT